jgi:hypothetical protein
VPVVAGTPRPSSVRRLRPRAGVPPPRKFEDSRSVNRFEAISSTLCASGVPADACSSRELGRLTGRLMLFAGTSLGRDVPIDERVQGVTKLPSRFFADFSRDLARSRALYACASSSKMPRART